MRPSRASSTARLIAAATLAARQDGLEPRPADESVHLAQKLLAQSTIGRLLAWSTQSRVGRVIRRAIEQVMVPGFVQHVARRKAWIERACRASIAAGTERLLILGAGFDGLGMHFAVDHPDLKIIEADHPATQRAKTAAISRAAKSRLSMSAIDLSRQPLTKRWLGIAVGVDHLTIVAEGLLMYLPHARVDHMLEEMTALTTGQIDLLFTFMENQPDGRPGFRAQGWAVGRWLGAVREPFL